VGVLHIPAPASAQPLPGPGTGTAIYRPRSDFQARTRVLAVNALLGGVTAAVRGALHGESLLTAFPVGLLGGALHFGGKWVGAKDFDGAQLVGRQVAAAGSSVIRNAGDGRGLFAELVAPLGPLRVYVAPGEARPVRVKVDAITVFGTLYAVIHAGAGIDLDRSLSTGALVFGPGELPAQARTIGGAITYGEVAPQFESFFLQHEMIHVMQHDLALTAWSTDLEGWVAGVVGRPAETIHRFVDLGLYVPAVPLVQALDSGIPPWEEEAIHLAHPPGP